MKAPKQDATRRRPRAGWALQDARNHFSELFDRALGAPQVVTRHGRDEVIVVGRKIYDEMASGGGQRSVLATLRACPVPGFLRRVVRGPARQVDL